MQRINLAAQGLSLCTSIVHVSIVLQNGTGRAMQNNDVELEID